MRNEPLWTVAGIVAMATAVVGLLVAFGLPLTPEQQVAILGLMTVAAPLIVAWLTRPKVTPNAAVVAVMGEDSIGPVAADAHDAPNGTPVAVLTRIPPLPLDLDPEDPKR